MSLELFVSEKGRAIFLRHIYNQEMNQINLVTALVSTH